MGYTLNYIKDLPQVGSDEQTVKFERDPDIWLAQGRDNQQGEAHPRLIGAEEVTVCDLEDQSQGGRMSSSGPEMTKEILEQGSAANT